MHGGDIYNNRIKLDFSVNTNPLGMPKRCVDLLREDDCSLIIEAMTTYPDNNCSVLRQLLANKYSQCCILEADNVICANGASDIIKAITRIIKPVRALLFAPCFSGYEYALKQIETKLYYCYADNEMEFKDSGKICEQIKEVKPSLFFLTNPNNPTGILLDKSIIIDILNTAKNNDCMVVVDECFIELIRDYAKYSAMDLLNSYDNLLVINAFTKSYAMAGLRLGFAMSRNKTIISQIANELCEWNVSRIAQILGERALLECEPEYLNNSIMMIETEREWLTNQLTKLGYKAFRSDVNYLLFRDDNVEYLEEGDSKQGYIYRRLLNKGILIRDCSDYVGLGPGYYRIAVKRHEDNMYLIGVLSEIIN